MTPRLLRAVQPTDMSWKLTANRAGEPAANALLNHVPAAIQPTLLHVLQDIL